MTIVQNDREFSTNVAVISLFWSMVILVILGLEPVWTQSLITAILVENNGHFGNTKVIYVLN